VRSAALTLPGFVHDVCSSAYPFAAGSPCFAALPLAEHGLRWIHAPVPLAHPLEGRDAVVLDRSLATTAAALGRDGRAWRASLERFVAHRAELMDDVLAPPHWPASPALLARFGWSALQSARGLAERRFREVRTRALLAGLAVHGTQPLESPATAAFALLFAVLGHTVGWPIVEGGAQRLTAALVSCLRAAGGEIECGREIRSLADLPAARAVLLDVTPRQLEQIAGGRLPAREQRRAARYRYGPGVFKLDWALAGPIPWAAPACARAATVHVGGTLEEIAAAEATVAGGVVAARPFVLLVQPSLFDPTRAPAGRHTAWGYCHVPNGCDADQTAAIEAQVERFAPGFRERILARHGMGPGALEAHNPNCIGGDIAGGALAPGQLITRPSVRWNPYATGIDGVYLCSASTPPGAGVHGLCGWHAARRVLRERFAARGAERA
jgi:phytoene dehydrogenase-like protein